MILTAIWYAFAMLVIFYLLAVVCDRYFIWSLEIISKKLKLSDDVAWATFMAIGTSAPEFFTAAMAVIMMSNDVGAGTIIGSAIFNILVITGASALMKSATLKPHALWRDTIVYLIAIIILYFTFSDGVITLLDTLWYIGAYACYIVVLANRSKISVQGVSDHREPVAADLIKEEEALEKKSGLVGTLMHWVDSAFDLIYPNLSKKPWLYTVTFALSILFIIILSKFLVDSGVWFATALGIPPVIIALTILAGGTSVPDLLASIIVAKKWQADMAVANAVGSNIFDILICLGLPWIVAILWTGKPIVVGTEWLQESVLILFGIMVIISFYMIVNKYRINKTYGILLIGIYLAYLAYQIYLAI